MNTRFPTFGVVCANLLFCLAVICFFGNNTTLRLPAVGALYKEYLTGCLALGLFYFQKIVIYPKLSKSITLRFIMICLFSALISTILEILLIYPQVMGLLMANYPRNEAFGFMMCYGFFIFLRDVGVLVTSFFVCEYKSRAQLCDIYEIRIREKTKEIPVRLVLEDEKKMMALPPSVTEVAPCLTEGESSRSEQPNPDSSPVSHSLNDLTYLPVSDIWYCIQMNNTLFICSLYNKIYFRSQSLKKVKILIGEQHFFQVSRDTIVMKKYVSHVDENFVEIENPVTKKTKSFALSDAYRTDELMLWKQEISASDSGKDYLSEGRNETNLSLEKPVNGHDLLKQKNHKAVYTYIIKHPYCKASTIVNKTTIPLGTVNRILAQLKADGLIEYTGSKKTGGYRTVEKKE